MLKNLLNRILNISKAQAHTTLDAIEDPVQMMNLAVIELEESISKLSKAVAVAVANQKKLEKDYEQFKLEAMAWHQKATVALQSGKEDLAKQALTHKTLALKKEEEYGLLAQNSKKMVQQLYDQLDDYKLRLQEARTKQKIYAAKAETAKTQRQIAESLGGLNSSALANMEKYENQINQISAEAEAISELSSNNRNLDREIREIETSLIVEGEYEKLKRQLFESAENQRIENVKRYLDSPAFLPEKTTESTQKLDNLLNEFFKK